MIERTPILNAVTHAILGIGLALMCFPIIIVFVAATLPYEKVIDVPMTLVPGSQLLTNAATAWERGEFSTQGVNTVVMTLGILFGKIALASLTAFAICYFNFRFRMLAFWLIFITLMLPLEVRIVPTYEVAGNALLPFQTLLEALYVTDLVSWLGGIDLRLEWNLLDTYWGLTLPLFASATATFLFRQFYLTVPEELTEAAKMDGAGPLRYFFDILLPLSKTNVAALSVIMFVFGWNQYLWPLLITTEPEMRTLVMGLENLMPQEDELPEWNVAMAGTLMVMLPPVAVVLALQRWFVKGLLGGEK
ncbi:MAG: ABC transporter permease subunit [Methyloligellaceae bacterium]